MTCGRSSGTTSALLRSRCARSSRAEAEDARPTMMSDDENEDGNREWSRFWLTARQFWLGSAAWRVWLLCAALIVLVVLQLYVQFRFNYWNRSEEHTSELQSPD